MKKVKLKSVICSKLSEWVRDRGMVDEGVVGVRSLHRNSRRLADELGVHCLLSLGGLRGRSLGVTLVTRSVRWGFVYYGWSPSERENT